ncbi:anti-sigma factor [Staphylococcus phage Twort]|uniref:ORF065 n=2 Tax=Staphylococcus phage Twort (strain DSM 17442 / HER 48) TaxID=2908167 RepID=Q4Z9B5_BPTWO|nr:anti-sigma factor [Staphylococcus phage Twort]AAX92360.1 ORF065 [Staphylococcus phage Twort]QIW89133.1 anti-sigma factor [Staphylococcus phage Twort]
MKLKIKNKFMGVLEVTNSMGVTKLDVPLSNIHEWYPFSNAYSYKYNVKTKDLVLKRLRSSLPVSYGIERASKEYDKDKVCNTVTWINHSVKDSNLHIINKAKSYGLPVITEKYTYEDVDYGFAQLNVIFSELKSLIINRYLEDKDGSFIVKFKRHNPETQYHLAVQDADEVINNTYDELGQMYKMLLLMKKLSKY